MGQAGQTQGLQTDPTESPDHQPNSQRQGKPEVKLESQPMGQDQAQWGVTSIKHSPVMTSEIHGDEAGLTSSWEISPRVKDWINRLHGANTGKAVAELEVGTPATAQAGTAGPFLRGLYFCITTCQFYCTSLFICIHRDKDLILFQVHELSWKHGNVATKAWLEVSSPTAQLKQDCHNIRSGEPWLCLVKP